MARVAGIQIEKDSKGLPAYARVNLKIHGEALASFFNQVGANEKDEFDIAFENGITIEDAKNEMSAFLKDMFKTSPNNMK